MCCSLGLYRDLLEDQVREYVESYAARFGLTRHVRFGHAVTSVSPTASGGWEIAFTTVTTTSKGCTDEDDVQHQQETFDRCIIASGIFSEPYFPPPTVVGGVTDAVRAGWATHGGAYREPAFCVGKTVLVVGCAFSGAEIASGGSEMSAWVAHLRNVSWEVVATMNRTLLRSGISSKFGAFPPYPEITRFTRGRGWCRVALANRYLLYVVCAVIDRMVGWLD